MKKICSVVGARPQFIKLAVVSRVLRKEFQEVLIHTGQHYDHNMSDVFFEEMDIPKPDYNLGISGGSHGKMTGEMLEKLEEVFIKEAPDMVLVFGDTNSTMAAALAAVKLHIPICHVEAGNRLGTLESPEEVNRIVTDHVSSLHLVCTPSGVEFLRREGFQDSVVLVGDPMYDAFCYYTGSWTAVNWRASWISKALRWRSRPNSTISPATVRRIRIRTKISGVFLMLWRHWMPR